MHYADESSSTMMRVALDVDGRRVGAYACQNVPGGTITGVPEQSEYLRSFVFSPLVVTGAGSEFCIAHDQEADNDARS